MRTHYCGEVNEALIGQTLEVAGWAHRRRDHGGVIFIDLRDRSGCLQIVIDPETQAAFSKAQQVRHEFVLTAKGRLRLRPEGTANERLSSGQLELLCTQLTILNVAQTPPFMLDDDDTSEEVRLQYRYIDLRRPLMQNNLRLRCKVLRYLRDFLDQQGFLDIQTPILSRSTPEGARDYLVPSRTYPGNVFALPQSPQLFKQLLMIAGFDRYYQMASCFRDEDLRADRQPEFTQLDIETSFMEESAIMDLMESMIRQLFKAVLDVDLVNPFPRLSYTKAIEQYGTDRPDLRIDWCLVDLTDIMQDVEFKVFRQPAQDPKGRVVALNIPGGVKLTRKQIDDYTAYVGGYGAKGLAYIKVNQADANRRDVQSPILKFLPDTVITDIIQRTGANDGDLLFFGAGKSNVVNESMAALRVTVAHDLKLLRPGWCPLWVTQAPMFEWDERQNRYKSLHHPFTAPMTDSVHTLKQDRETLLSRAYDMVLNGNEIGGGSIRIHQADMQEAVLQLLGIDKDQAEQQFGFLLKALRSGCPPHGGIAFGLDRLLMLMSGANSIREVIAFPKTQTANCLLTRAPSPATQRQLGDLGLQCKNPS